MGGPWVAPLGPESAESKSRAPLWAPKLVTGLADENRLAEGRVWRVWLRS